MTNRAFNQTRLTHNMGSSLLLLVLLCVFMLVSPAVSEETEPAIKGDVNKDGVVDQVDTVLILQMYTRQVPDQDVNAEADVNQDGKIGLPEAVYALQTAAWQTDCGAYVAPGVWRGFDCYNLGAVGRTTQANPFIPSWRLIGGHWQWGRKGPDPDQWYDTNTEHFAHGPLGPGSEETNTGEIIGWDETVASDGAWSDAAKTADDPCPPGFRMPSQAQWQGVVDNNTQTVAGTWSRSATNYTSARSFGDKLTLPAAGNRDNHSGALYNRGTNGYYWSNTRHLSDNAWFMSFSSSKAYTGNYNRKGGFSVRCITR